MRIIVENYAPLGSVKLEGMWIPVFNKNSVIEEHDFQVFESNCQYNRIMGDDFFQTIGMKLDYKNLKVEWFSNNIPMETRPHPDLQVAHLEVCLQQLEEEDRDVELDNYFSSPILDAKYKKADIATIIRYHCAHLSKRQ